MKFRDNGIVILTGLMLSFSASSAYSNSVSMPINEWIGGVGNWNISSNWSQNHIPLVNEAIEINGASDMVTIPSGYNAVAQSISNAGSLIISSTGSLSVNINFNSSIGIKNNGGVIDNEGEIMVMLGTGTNAYGIHNENGGNFENHGTITIRDFIGNNADGVYNDTGATFMNHQNMFIINLSGSNSDGVTNDGDFDNFGLVSVDSVLHGSGIVNLGNGVFSSELSVSCSNIEEHGIRLIGGTMTNVASALISISSCTLTGMLIEDGASMINEDRASIRILADTPDNHFNVLEGGVFDCLGEIDIIVN